MVQETVITVSLSRLGVISVTAGRRYCWWPTFPHASLSFSHSVSLLPQRSFQVFFPPLLSSPLLTHPGASVSLGLQSTPNSLPYPTAHSLWNKLSLSYSRRHSDTLPLMVFLLPPVTATPYYPQGDLSSFWWQVYPSCPLHFDPFLRFDLFFKKIYIYFLREHSGLDRTPQQVSESSERGWIYLPVLLLSHSETRPLNAWNGLTVNYLWPLPYGFSID